VYKRLLVQSEKASRRPIASVQETWVFFGNSGPLPGWPQKQGKTKALRKGDNLSLAEKKYRKPNGPGHL